MLLGGDRRPRPFLIIELVGNNAPLSDQEKDAKPCIGKASEKCSDYVKIEKDLAIFADPVKPFLRTAKETVFRVASVALYSEEIEDLYQKYNRGLLRN